MVLSKTKSSQKSNRRPKKNTVAYFFGHRTGSIYSTDIKIWYLVICDICLYLIMVICIQLKFVFLAFDKKIVRLHLPSLKLYFFIFFFLFFAFSIN